MTIKNRIVLVLALCASLLSGCTPIVPLLSAESTSVASDTAAASETLSAGVMADTIHPAVSATPDLQKYYDLYRPLVSYQDQYIPNRHLLIAVDRVILLFLTDGYDAISTVSVGDICVVDAYDLGDAVFVRLCLDDGAAIEMPVSAQDAEDLLRIINTLRDSPVVDTSEEIEEPQVISTHGTHDLTEASDPVRTATGE